MVDGHSEKYRALIVEALDSPRFPVGLSGRGRDLHYFLSAPITSCGGVNVPMIRPGDKVVASRFLYRESGSAMRFLWPGMWKTHRSSSSSSSMSIEQMRILL